MLIIKLVLVLKKKKTVRNIIIMNKTCVYPVRNDLSDKWQYGVYSFVRNKRYTFKAKKKKNCATRICNFNLSNIQLFLWLVINWALKFIVVNNFILDIMKYSCYKVTSKNV